MTRTNLSAFWAESCFVTAGGAQFHCIDAAVGAMVRGDWPPFERRLTEGLSASARGRDEGLTVDSDAIEMAATAFRYEKDLISGDEVSAWLDRAGFTATAWHAYLARALLRERFIADLDATVDRYPPSARQLHEAALAEGICSGQFAAFETALARRVALALDADATAVAAQNFAPDVIHDASRLARRHAHWFESEAANNEIVERFARSLRIERAFAAVVDGLATENALHAIVETRRMDWTRLAVLSLSLATEHAAREAMLCVTLDGLALDDVAQMARRAVQRANRFVEDVPEPLRMALFTADIGRVVGPLAVDGGFEVVMVTGHIAPSLDDDDVRTRARRTVIEGTADRLASERLRGNGLA